MDILKASRLQALSTSERKKFEGLLPEIVKRLIKSGIKNIETLHMPSGDDVWTPGFDGILECNDENLYVSKGVSVWEFGNSAKSLKKISEDYKKRTDDSQGIEKDKATFYLVVPKIWKYSTPKNVWEKERKEWHKVKVYDATDLCDWINSEPMVLSWLMEEFFDDSIGFSTLESAWNSFARKTKPPFIHKLFLDNRDTEKVSLLSLDKEKILIKGETFIDAEGFALSALLHKENHTDDVIVIENKKTYEVLSKEVEGKTFLLNFPFEGDVYTNNSVIILFNKEAVSVKPDIELSMLKRSHYEKAFRDMGMSPIEAIRLYSKTHGNMRAIIRSIPGTTIEPKPDWANEQEIEILLPLLLLGRFNRNNDGEKKIISELANKEYQEIERVYKRLSKLEDSPIKVVDEFYVLVNYEETWNVLLPNTEDTIFDNMHSMVMRLLNSLSSKYKEENYGLSVEEIVSILGHLMNNYLSFYQYNGGSKKLNDAVTEIVVLLYDKNVRRIIEDRLWTFAMIAPEILMRYIEDDLSKDTSIVKNNFTGIEYNTNYVNYLSALDELALQAETSQRAIEVLFEIYLMGEKYIWDNSPKESLLNILCLWGVYGPLSLSSKVSFVKKIISSHPIEGCELAVNLLSKDGMLVVTRDDKNNYDLQNENVTEVYKSYKQVSICVMDMVLNLKSVELIQKATRVFYIMDSKDFMYYANIFDKDGYSCEELADLNFHFRHTMYGNEEAGNLNDEYRKGFKVWIEKTDAVDEDSKNLWMFRDYDNCPAEELIKHSDDYVSLRKNAKQMRIKTVRQLIGEKGYEATQKMIDTMSDSEEWGKLLAEIKIKSSVFIMSQAMISSNKMNILGGFLSKVKDTYAKEIFKSLPKDKRLVVVKCMERCDIQEWKLSGEEEANYWSVKAMWEYNEYAFNAILKHNPKGLLFYCEKVIKAGDADAIKTVIKVLNQIVSNTDITELNLGLYDIHSLVKRVDSIHYSEEWCRLCRTLMEKGFLKKYTEGLKKYYFYNPCNFYKHIKSNDDMYFQAALYYTLPDDAYRDYEALVDFTNNMINYNEIHLMGSIVGRTKDDEDGCFPHKDIMRLLEEINNEEFDQKVLAGKQNAGGLRAVSDGTEEGRLAEVYYDRANQLSIEYPHTARILEGMARDYENESRRDYIFSELRQ